MLSHNGKIAVPDNDPKSGRSAQDRDPPWQPTPEDIARLGIDPTNANSLLQLTVLMHSAYLAGRADALTEQAARWDKLKF